MQPTRNEIVDGIRKWVECESPSHSPDDLRKMAAIVIGQARAAGLKVTETDVGTGTGPVISITNRAPGDERAGILILGHYDTVHPVGTLGKNPCRVEEGKLFGPGTYDMKAGAYLALTAMGSLSQPGSSGLPIDFLMVPDEELGSGVSREHIEAHGKRAKYTLLGEPARANGGRCVTSRKGTGLAYVTVHGRPSHAGVAHEQGRNAILEMAHQIIAIEAMTDYEAGVTVNVGKIEGGTTTNVVPELCKVIVDFRLPSMPVAEAILAKFQALKAVNPDCRVEVNAVVNRPPMPRTDAVGVLFEKTKAIAQTVGIALEEAPTSGGGSDGNFVAALGVPVVDALGADGDGAHTLGEHILVETLPQRLEFWQKLLRDLD